MDRDISLDLRLIIYTVRKQWLTILLIPVIFVVISTVISLFLIPQKFEAKTTIIIGRAPASDKTVQYDEVLMYEKIVKTYSEIARSRLVAENTLKKLNKSIPIETFLDRIIVAQEPETQIMAIRIKSPTAEEAMLLTNTMAEVFIEECNLLYPVANIRIIDKAYLPHAPISPNVKLNIIIALCFGLVVSTGVIFLSDYFKLPIKSNRSLPRNRKDY